VQKPTSAKKANVNNNNKAAGPGPEVITSALVSNMKLKMPGFDPEICT